MIITDVQKQKAELQIIEEKVPVDYDTREFTVEHIIEKFANDEYIIPPYQREFVWDNDKQSKFIESVLLDLPIPYIFFADVRNPSNPTEDGKLEIVDGSQRIRTLLAFKKNELILSNLEKLDNLNGFYFKDLLESRQRRFLRKTLRSIELTEKAAFETKKDIFRRINTDPYDLSDMEIRKGIYHEGLFYTFIKNCSENKLFKSLCPVSEKRSSRGERQELVLRFFAYLENYQKFTHRVDEFLDNYMSDKHKNGFDEEVMTKSFEQMLHFVNKNFPNGFRKNKTDSTTPRVRFEAISVGVALAIKQKPSLLTMENIQVQDWLESEEFKLKTTSDGANNRLKVIGRIEFVKKSLLS